MSSPLPTSISVIYVLTRLTFRDPFKTCS
uniref:Uncharacterized protein n=1 Tax=Rhizophora mucronata TaxID=61149 RepID=A0A2P2QHY2_RHIMU